MFQPPQNTDGAGQQSGGDATSHGPALRNILEFCPTAFERTTITSSQLTSILHEFGVRSAPLFARDLFDPLVRGELPEMGCIIHSHLAENRGEMNTWKVWQIGRSGVRHLLECEITLQEQCPDLRHLLFSLRSDNGSDTVALSITFNESSVAFEGTRPDRWLVFEKVLAGLRIRGPRPRLELAPTVTALELGDGAHLKLHGIEEIGARAMQDPHLPLRPDLAADVLGAERYLPTTFLARSLGDRICGGRNSRVRYLEATGTIEEGWNQLMQGQQKEGIPILGYQGLLVPISRTATLDTIRSDIEKLLQIRSDIVALGPDASLVSPVEARLYEVTVDEAHAILEIAGLPLPKELITHLHQVMVSDAQFEPERIHPDKFSGPETTIRLGQIAVSDPDHEYSTLPCARLSRLGAPRISFFPYRSETLDIDGSSTLSSRTHLSMVISWPIERGRVQAEESIARWRAVTAINSVVGEPPLPEQLQHFFDTDSCKESTSERIEVVTFKMPPSALLK
ncbi:MAG: hypothetical protein EBZ48_01080 [Proteobacteria bacterium]|nr:hypothetical protein [Pseudomonadota bacterium]